MTTEEKKTCFDCLHCKVSTKSTEINRLCFCVKSKKKGKHQDYLYISVKKIQRSGLRDPEVRKNRSTSPG